MIITIDNTIRLPLAGLRPGMAEEIKLRLTFKNPAYGEAVGRMRAMGKAGRPYGVPEEIVSWAAHNGNLVIPRGCAWEVFALLDESKHNYQVKNRTRTLPEVDFKFSGALKPAQEPAVQAILERRFATISSPTGSGKTVMGLYVIAIRRQPALVVVHTANLMRQWVERAMQFLGIPEVEIGIVGQGSRTVGPRLTIALVQTLRKCAREIAPRIGHVICDEVHHAPAATFTEALAPFDSAFALGLSATHKRRDGLDPLIYWHVGPLVHEVSRSALIRDGDIIQVEPVIRNTQFIPSGGYDPAWQRALLMSELTANVERNALIAADVAREALDGPCIVLTDRVSHCADLAAAIFAAGETSVEICHGGVPRVQQEAIVQAMNDGRLQVLVATGQLLGEGFDCKRLTALFLATPIKWEGRLIQFLGRVARSSAGKTAARVYDYVDVHVDVLMKAARERLRTYRKLSQQEKAPTLKREK